jgi:hypothetical protein
MSDTQQGEPGGPPATQEPPLSPQTIDWTQALLRSSIGAYGLVYEVAPGVMAKVGFILPEEAERQGRLAERGWALPVLGYAQDLDLPRFISKAVCAEHGLRELDEDMVACCCDAPLSVLLMPEADPAIWEHFDEAAVAAFIAQVDAYCSAELGADWDAEDRNVAVYQGRLVALDFGDPEAPCC